VGRRHGGRRSSAGIRNLEGELPKSTAAIPRGPPQDVEGIGKGKAEALGEDPHRALDRHARLEGVLELCDFRSKGC
jgi:hypothetical protein